MTRFLQLSAVSVVATSVQCPFFAPRQKLTFFLHLGDCFAEWIKQYGYTFRMNIFGEARVGP